MDVGPLIEVKGIIIAAQWGADGAVTAVDIAGFDEKRYRVVNDRIGRQLHKRVKHSVRVSGRTFTDDRHTMLSVEPYTLDADEPAME